MTIREFFAESIYRNLLQRFKEIEAMPEREQNVIVEVITAFIRDFKAKQAYLI